jgi:preprotein translocase subunit SecD
MIPIRLLCCSFALLLAVFTPLRAAEPPAASPFAMRLVADQAGEDTEELAEFRYPNPPRMLHVRKQVLLDQTSVESAFIAKGVEGRVEIHVHLTGVGGEKFATVTRENKRRQLAIVVGGRMLSAPTIHDEIRGGKMVISGKYSEEEARALAAEIAPAPKEHTGPPPFVSPFQMRLTTPRPTPGTEELDEPAGDFGPTPRSGAPRKIHVEKGTVLNHADLASVKAIDRDPDGAPTLELTFTADGAKKLAQITQERKGDCLAIFLDGHLHSAPMIATPIEGGVAHVTGRFNKQEAQALADKISAALKRQPKDERKP